ncbi:hypothetical protein K469DRAFT_693378 [Zopfia rhizophila CBS 207.26]|uniref:RING-type domain-containing protein n=1 Tax=Zopfia rhizophila CBS 207.26 TaxID=1314779 RepID=A0A6A6DL88_9PEZI|nr:hypothetical protein K469DRAFT_693378 [Zopfia rhizophila CBS 207.26]
MVGDASLPSKEEFIRDKIDLLRECAICWMEFDSNHIPPHISGTQTCGHVFGEVCLRKWFEANHKGSNACLLCREVLFQKDDEGDEGEETDEDDYEDGPPEFQDGYHPENNSADWIEHFNVRREAGVFLKDLWRKLG